MMVNFHYGRISPDSSVKYKKTCFLLVFRDYYVPLQSSS